MKHFHATWVLALVLGMVQRPAAAQTATEKALASQLFDEASQLTKAGKLAEACPKLAESQRLDAQLGTLLHLADCYEKTGKTASAWALFREAAGVAEKRKDKRESLANTRRAALESSLPKVKLDVAPGAPANLEIQQDDTAIGKIVWGTAMPVDPGSHRIRAHALGYKEWSTSITVPSGANVVHVAIPNLEAEPPATVPGPATEGPKLATVETPGAAQSSPAPNAQSVAPNVASSPADNPASGSSWQRPTGFVVGALGVVGLGLGAVFLVRRQSMISELDQASACRNTAAGCSLVDEVLIAHRDEVVKNDGTVAYAGFIAGGVLVVTGMVLILAAPSSSPAPKTARKFDVQPWVGYQNAGVAVSGRW